MVQIDQFNAFGDQFNEIISKFEMRLQDLEENDLVSLIDQQNIQPLRIIMDQISQANELMSVRINDIGHENDKIQLRLNQMEENPPTIVKQDSDGLVRQLQSQISQIQTQSKEQSQTNTKEVEQIREQLSKLGKDQEQDDQIQ